MLSAADFLKIHTYVIWMKHHTSEVIQSALDSTEIQPETVAMIVSEQDRRFRELQRLEILVANEIRTIQGGRKQGVTKPNGNKQNQKTQRPKNPKGNVRI